MRFRAVVVTPQLKPSVVGSIDVIMTDGGGNIVRRWERVFTTKGVFAGQIELAQAPVLGKWNITVDVSAGQLFSKDFQVFEFSPLFANKTNFLFFRWSNTSYPNFASP